MATISQSQWDRLGQDSFDARLVAILREHHPAQAAALPFAELVHAIHRQTARARLYGLNDERSAASYVYTAFLMGEEFDRRIPGVQQILRDRRMTAGEKGQALAHFDQLVFGALADAAAAAEERSVA